MRTIDPTTTSVQDFYHYLTGTVAPRPIAFVSSLDKDGVPNLAPFSYFNVFSASPPLLAFAPGNSKHTLANIKETKECVVNMVNFDIVQQMNVASGEYPKGVNEFIKAGLTPIESMVVKPFRIKESPVQMECVVEQIIPLKTQKAADTTTMIVCRVVKMHLAENILDAKGRIDAAKIDLMGRLGGLDYARCNGNLVSLPNLRQMQPIGFDALPAGLLESTVFTGNNLGQFAALGALPTKEEVLDMKGRDRHLQKIMVTGNVRHSLHLYAQEYLSKGDVQSAIRIALLGEYL